LIGTWPLLPFNQGEEITYLQRIQDYMDKAAKEAKMQTNWINPNRIHEESLKQFIANILKNPPFLQDFVPFAARISSLGMLNSLSQTLLKLTSPGVPDIYQGCEIWNFRLVDPDNRHPVDYGLRKKLLLKLKEENLETILQTAESGAIKLLIIKKTLDFRYQHRELFSSGTYIPLKIKGDLSQHLIAYARVKDREVAIVVATRYFSFLFRNFKDSLQTEIWKNNSIELPVELASCKFTHIFTDKMISSENGLLDLQSILPPLCVALLANTTT
jgi:(1->4)-alpha-D-glucan 1-alpha-D-glucosylmutase